MENRRFFLAAFLSLILVLLWGRFVQPPAVQPEPPTTEVRSATPPATSLGLPGSETPATIEAGDVGSPAAEASEPEPVAAVAATSEQTTTVETAHYRATFTNRGGTLASLVLIDEFTEDGETIEMLRARGPADPAAFGLVFGDGEQHPINEALFVANRVEDETGATVLHYEHRSPLGGAEKRYRIQPNGLIEVEASVDGRRDWGLFMGPGVRDLTPEEMDDRWIQRLAVLLRGDDEEKLQPGKKREPILTPGPGLQWATLEDNYFLTVMVPAAVQTVMVLPVGQRDEAAEGQRFVLGPIDEAAAETLSMDQALLVANGGDPVRFTAFFGSKRYDQLAELPYGFERTVRWGFFGFVARPMYYGLRWIHERIPNYGWAIVLMTLVIKLLFFPLTHKSQKSMAKMQEINPQVQALRNRYRGKLKDKNGRPNPEAQRQMNEEMLALYRKSGVNPASGCLPILIQIPVFFAFFRLLSTSVELRNAPWLGWVQDLSVPDPWYLLPLLMLVTSVMLQRMTPPPPDPMQRRIMQMFPIMFGFFAITFPSGLVLYWLTNNILSMAQQAYYLKSKDKS